MPQPAAGGGASSDGLPVGVALLLALAVGVLAAAVTAVVARRAWRRPAGERAASGAGGTGAAGSGAPASPAPDDGRNTLVEALIEALDTMDPRVVHSQRAALALHAVGVECIDPTGARFDPSRHQQVDTVVTDDARLDGLVASVDRFGYVDRGQLRRFPQVVVYRALPAASSAR